MIITQDTHVLIELDAREAQLLRALLEAAHQHKLGEECEHLRDKLIYSIPKV